MNKKALIVILMFLLAAVLQTVSCKKNEDVLEYSILGTWIVVKYEEGRGPVTVTFTFVGDETQGETTEPGVHHHYTVDGLNVEWSFFTHGCLSRYTGQFTSPTVMEGDWYSGCRQTGTPREGYWRAEKSSD